MKTINAKTFWLCLMLGVMVRFAVMLAGHNFDFESWKIVGELAAEGKNVYANTGRYNYGPVWFMLLGLFWRAASYFANSTLVFRCLIVGTLTLCDFSLTLLISRKAGNFWGIVFFLNPISLIITGYHNQFDNLAVLIGSLAVMCLEKSCTEHKIKPEDIYGTLLLSLSLITKHIAWAFPLWILFNENIDRRKKFIYSFIPPLLFLTSFVPFWSEGSLGIIRHVFLYRSFNNFPLFGLGIINRLGMSIPMQKYICLPTFGLLLLAAAYTFRRENICHSFMLYSIALVCLSSAIANQYLAIPCAAVILLCKNKSAIYFLMGMAYLSCDANGLHIPLWLNQHLGFRINILLKILSNGTAMYTLLAWCLLYYLVLHYWRNLSR